MRSRTFTVIMGQAFAEHLPAHLRTMGGRVSQIKRGIVEVSVNVAFTKPKSHALVQKFLWKEYPYCSVDVKVRKP